MIIEEWSPGEGLTKVRCCACQQTCEFAPPQTVKELEEQGFRPIYEDRRRQREGSRIAWVCYECGAAKGPILRNP
jgi:hypothetical protein